VPSLIAHIAVPLAGRALLGPEAIPRRVLVAGLVLCALPDLDVIAFRFGIPYASPWGHRGFTHSIAFGLVVALVCWWMLRPARPSRFTETATATYLVACAVSHGLLDGLTNGGLGSALWWPLSDDRWFAPFRPIQVSPIGHAFFSSRGLAVIQSEAIWIGLPALAISLIGLAVRRRLTARRTERAA
jgi:inner membrane protein